MSKESELQPPLTETVFYILLAVTEPLHGYGIIQKVEKLTNRRIQLGPGTLYGAIKTLLNKGAIELVNVDKQLRRKEYKLTDQGYGLLEKEIERLEELLKNGTDILKGGKVDE